MQIFAIASRNFSSLIGKTIIIITNKEIIYFLILGILLLANFLKEEYPLQLILAQLCPIHFLTEFFIQNLAIKQITIK